LKGKKKLMFFEDKMKKNYFHRSTFFIWNCTITVMFLHMSVGLLNFVTEAQQRNITHTTTTLSEVRSRLISTSSNELVFFGDGYNSTGQASDRADMSLKSTWVWNAHETQVHTSIK
jgi:hypothetical protein